MKKIINTATFSYLLFINAALPTLYDAGWKEEVENLDKGIFKVTHIKTQKKLRSCFLQSKKHDDNAESWRFKPIPKSWEKNRRQIIKKENVVSAHFLMMHLLKKSFLGFDKERFIFDNTIEQEKVQKELIWEVLKFKESPVNVFCLRHYVTKKALIFSQEHELSLYSNEFTPSKYISKDPNWSLADNLAQFQWNLFLVYTPDLIYNRGELLQLGIDWAALKYNSGQQFEGDVSYKVKFKQDIGYEEIEGSDYSERNLPPIITPALEGNVINRTSILHKRKVESTQAQNHSSSGVNKKRKLNNQSVDYSSGSISRQSKQNTTDTKESRAIAYAKESTNSNTRQNMNMEENDENIEETSMIRDTVSNTSSHTAGVDASLSYGAESGIPSLASTKVKAQITAHYSYSLSKNKGKEKSNETSSSKRKKSSNSNSNLKHNEYKDSTSEQNLRERNQTHSLHKDKECRSGESTSNTKNSEEAVTQGEEIKRVENRREEEVVIVPAYTSRKIYHVEDQLLRKNIMKVNHGTIQLIFTFKPTKKAKKETVNFASMLDLLPIPYFVPDGPSVRVQKRTRGDTLQKSTAITYCDYSLKNEEEEQEEISEGSE